MNNKTKECDKCHQVKPASAFRYCKFTRDRLVKVCRECNLTTLRRKPHEVTVDRMIRTSRYHAGKRGLAHTITKEDLHPCLYCKYLGSKLDYRSTDERTTLLLQNTPSIDRIDSSKGYVPGNVQIISTLANRMKNNATIPQLIAFAKGVLKVHGTVSS